MALLPEALDRMHAETTDFLAGLTIDSALLKKMSL
jgi:hypothetical protein